MTYQEELMRDKYAQAALAATYKYKLPAPVIHEISYVLAFLPVKHDEHLKQEAAKLAKATQTIIEVA